MVTAKLLIDGKFINVLWFSYRFNQSLDTYGKPLQEPVFLGLSLTLESQHNLDLANWSTDPELTKQLELHIPPVDERTKTRKLYFYDCYLIKWKNNFSSSGTDPKTETIHISAGGVSENNSKPEYSAYWRVTYEQNIVKVTTLEDPEPKFIEYHFESIKGELIEEKDIRANQEIDLVITTENANGTTIKINLNNSRLDFIYNEKILENDILKGIKIENEETRVTLTAIKQ
ncbi:hypothetical protein I2486_16045 [Cellulophaga sp. E16_2]|uniref:type VI secretion system tube protein TssD n=1 Tax=Cellulophaga sp. E16_2 TaxID=2789297 RepID=UPI001A91BFAE|nr:type VI secretion system tube protein TssD [Cellulophaga sp. E16_2]MBO0592917.1 hypothetical protein [Cellulophaga sp. E16_2]